MTRIYKNGKKSRNLNGRSLWKEVILEKAPSLSNKNEKNSSISVFSLHLL